MSNGTSGIPVPFTSKGAVLSVKKRVARFWSSGCRKGSLAAFLSTIGLALLKTLRLWGELPAKAVLANSALKSRESLILDLTRWRK
jgi:hypothetical protein